MCAIKYLYINIFCKCQEEEKKENNHININTKPINKIQKNTVDKLQGYSYLLNH